MKLSATVFAVLLPVMAVMPWPAAVHAHAQPVAAAQSRVTLEQAVAIARRQVPGKVIGADTRERRGRIVHQVKILTPEGTVRVVRVDGESGRVLR